MLNEKYTHIAKLYGIPCFFNEETMDVKGTNWVFDKLIDLGVFFDTTFNITDGFYITNLQEIEKVD